MPTTSDCYCTAARKAARKISRLYDQALAGSGLSVSQYSILAEIERRAPDRPTIKELAEALIMDRSTLGQNLRPLLRSGIVALVTNESDGRSKRAKLSKRGRTKFDASRELWKCAQRNYAAAVGTGVADRARDIMNTLASSERF